MQPQEASEGRTGKAEDVSAVEAVGGVGDDEGVFRTREPSSPTRGHRDDGHDDRRIFQVCFCLINRSYPVVSGAGFLGGFVYHELCAFEVSKRNSPFKVRRSIISK